MTFREILALVVDGTPGALAGAIMAGDGIPLDEYQAPGSDVDLTAIAVEFEGVLQQARKVTGAVFGDQGGVLEELVLTTGGPQLLFRHIDAEYFLVVALEGTGSLGKARYLVRSILQKVRQEL